MSAAKVTISLDAHLLRELDSLVKTSMFRTRSEAAQIAIQEKLERLGKGRLARECAKLSKVEEQAFAEEGMAADAKEWPVY